MLIAWDNKADAASALTVSSEIATLPGANVQQPHVSRKWHTAAAVKDAYLLFDLGSSLSCALFAALGTNLTAAATVRIRCAESVADVTAAPLYDSTAVNAGVVAGYGAAYKSFTAQAARYWRLDFTDATLPDNIQVGRVFLGPKWTPSINQLYGWRVRVKDDSKVARSYGGQSYVDVRPQTRVLKFELDYMSEAEMYGNAFAMARTNGLVSDILVIPDSAGTYLSQQAVWGLLSASEPLVHRIPLIYRQAFTVEERL